MTEACPEISSNDALPNLPQIKSVFEWFLFSGDKDGSKVTTVGATPGQGPDRPQEVSYTDTKVIGNGSFGVVYQAKLCDTGELVAIKKVLQDKRFKVRMESCLFLVWRTLKHSVLITRAESSSVSLTCLKKYNVLYIDGYLEEMQEP